MYKIVLFSNIYKLFLYQLFRTDSNKYISY